MKYDLNSLSDGRKHFIVVVCVCVLLPFLMNVARVKSWQKVSIWMWLFTAFVSLGVGGLIGLICIAANAGLLWIVLCTALWSIFSERIIQRLIELSQDELAFDKLRESLKAFILKKIS